MDKPSGGALEKLLEMLGKMRPYAAPITFLIIAFVVFVGSGLQFISSQGNICSKCHEISKQVSSLQESPHSSISCMSCHGEPDYFSFLTIQLRAGNNAIKWLSNTYGNPITSTVKNEYCINCHSKIMSKTVISTKNGIRISHKEISSRRCTSCHSAIAHDTKARVRNYPNMETCMSCHDCINDSSCATCHASEMPKKTASSRSAWDLTHGSNWEKTHGMGDQRTCLACHKTEMCIRCHGTEIPHPQPWSYLHAEAAKQNIESCSRCHKNDYCLNCHRLQMPHPEGFLKGHSDIVKDVGKDVCWRCHNEDNCTPCHIQATHPFTKKGNFKQ